MLKKNNFASILYNQISLALAIIALVTAAFAVRNYFSDPTDQLKIESAVFEERIGSVEKQITDLKDNDLHSLGVSIQNVEDSLNDLSRDIVELRTILEERLPAKR